MINTFKVVPSRNNEFISEDRFYYDVYIFDDKAEMISIAQQLNQGIVSTFGAIVMPTRIEEFSVELNDWQITPLIGNVLFHKSFINTDVLAHEAVHMTTNWLRTINKLKLNDEIDEEEELLAYGVGNIVNQLTTGIFDILRK